MLLLLAFRFLVVPLFLEVVAKASLDAAALVSLPMEIRELMC